MPDLKLVIFDCDGVMFDSKDANREYYNHILGHFGHPPMDQDELDYVHAHHVMNSIKYIFRNYPADFEAAESYRKSIAYEPFIEYMVMEPDLPQFLDFLRPQFKTAISTNRTTTLPAVLKLSNLTDLFDKIVTALDVKRPKPDPEALYAILDSFSLSPDEAIYIGDTMVDREHTSAAGVRLIAFKNKKLPAEYHVDSFMEITKIPIFT